MSHRLPLIPLSPLILASIETAKYLSKITQKLSETPTSKILQKRLTTTRKKLDQITKNMDTIQNGFLSDFDIKNVAQEIAYIDIQLFQLAEIDPVWIKTFDKRANLIPLLDFHRYLSHTFAHEIISSANPEITIAQLIHIASVLFHNYHDLSGCSAILTCLQMPEIQRLEHAWEQCSARTIQCLHTILPLLSSPGRRNFMRDAVVPFAQAHLRNATAFCLKQPSKGILNSNPKIYHWLVSRAYLTRAQLCSETLQIVPLAQGEVLEAIEDHDFYWDFYRTEIFDDYDDSNSENNGTPETLYRENINNDEQISVSTQGPTTNDAASMKSEDSDNSEWNGYPCDESIAEEEEEVWKGYPVSNSEEEEVWKDYPEGMTNQSWKTSFDPWGKNCRIQAIEKTKHMEYSLTNSLILKKRISSPIVPSSASA